MHGAENRTWLLTFALHLKSSVPFNITLFNQCMNEVTEVREAGLWTETQISGLCRRVSSFPLPCASKINLWLIVWSKHKEATTQQTNKQTPGLSPPANYTDRVTAACRRN
jgi:hypothetical protein